MFNVVVKNLIETILSPGKKLAAQISNLQNPPDDCSLVVNPKKPVNPTLNEKSKIDICK